jgi:hypothetical protein
MIGPCTQEAIIIITSNSLQMSGPLITTVLYKLSKEKFSSVEKSIKTGA